VIHNLDCWEKYINYIEECNISYKDIVDIMFQFIKKINDFIPKDIQGEIEIAKKYWYSSKKNLQELKDSKVKIWKYHDENKDKLSEKNINAIRCLLFLFYPEPNNMNEKIDMLDYFFDFLSGIKDFCKDIDIVFSNILLSCPRVQTDFLTKK